MKATQRKIIELTEKYIKENYAEYVSVCESLKSKKELQLNKFASTGETHYVKQLAHVIPETLDNLLQANLKEDDWLYFKSIGGTRWFARKFPEFSPALKI